MSNVEDWIETRIAEQSNLTSPWTSSSTSEPGKMKVAYFSNEFPHDNLRDLLRRLHVRSKDLRYSILAKFIREAPTVPSAQKTPWRPYAPPPFSPTTPSPSLPDERRSL